MAAASVLWFFEWLGLRSVLTFLAVFLTFGALIKQKAPKNYPPGPWSLPIVGDLFRIDSSKIHLQFTEFAKQYGDIFTLRLGQNIVVVNGFKLVKEALVHHGENFADRPVLPLFEDVVHNCAKNRPFIIALPGGSWWTLMETMRAVSIDCPGLVNSNGYLWKQQRRFALSTLKNFGLGKKSLEPSIQVESMLLNEVIANTQGQPFDPQFTMINAVSNIICCLVFGDRFDYNDSYFQTLLKMINEAIYLEGSIWFQMYNMFPWLMRRIPGPHKKILLHWETVISFIRLKIKEHQEDRDPSSPRDYIDSFLSEMEKWKDDVHAGFNEENLCYCTFDLFVAGTETTSTTLYWGLLYMIKYPDIQEKVQAEIDSVIGRSRQPSMADRLNMPYTDAVIHEIQRMGNIVPLNVVRSTMKDTELGGYTIPKGTMLMGTLHSVLFDETEWETPFTFNPGHFLDAEGKFRRRDAFLPFSAGKRVCPGEQLARMELFLFFTSLLQCFTFSAPPGMEPRLEFKLGITLCPKPYKLCATPR